MRILYITTFGGTMGFFKEFIKELIANGNTVDIASNITERQVPDYYYEWGCKIYPLSCKRSPIKMENFNAIKEIRKIVAKGNYDIVHCHTPIAAMCTRLACRRLRKKGIKVFYTAHGFHFYKGAPLKNWMLYYPVEWICSFWTDVLITINTEDYAYAEKHMHAKKVKYVSGVGIDIQKFSTNHLSQKEKERLRASIGVRKENKLLLSVGELNANKNHEIVIRALAELHDETIHYAIAGNGILRDYLASLTRELGIADQVHLLGYRNDVADLYQITDLYIHPSFREGLSVALMEVIASKTPVICSNIRGNIDLVSGNATFKPVDISALKEKIKKYLDSKIMSEIEENYNNLKKYETGNVVKKMCEIYSEV